MRSVSWFVLLSVLPALQAQGGDPWSALRAKNPAGVEFTARLVDPHPYRVGELIQVEWKLPQPGGATGAGPPAEQWQFAGFLLTPSRECGTISKPCFAPEMRMGIVGGPPMAPVPIALNSHLPALSAGRYRAAALARKLMLTNSGAGYSSYGYADPVQYVVAEMLELEVVAASPQWVRETVARCAAILNGPEPGSQEGHQAMRDAAEQLVFLNDPMAWSAAFDALPKQESVLLRWISARPQAALCEWMKARVSAATQSVSSGYLASLAEVCAQTNLPPQPAASAGAPVAIAQARISTSPPRAIAVQQPSPEMQAWLEKRRAYMEEVTDEAAAALAASFPAKQAGPKWDSVAALLQYVRQVRTDLPARPDPAWIPVLSAEFVRSFPAVDVPRRQYLLDMYVSAIDSPALVPLLEGVMDSWKRGDYYEAAHAALRGLHRVDPERAQARILAELKKPETWLDVLSLDLLPASAAPPMDDALIEALARAAAPGGWNSQLSMAALAKYGTAEALPRVKAIYEAGQRPCEPELMAYFVRVEPAYADGVFRSVPWDMHAPPSRCAVQYFERTVPLAMSPGLEQYMSAYLMHSDVFVKTTAARSLAKYGTPAALPALWDTLRYFHKYWEGKGAELAQNGQSVALEVELRNAIARGRGWLATDKDLRSIAALCSSNWCTSETQQDLAAWEAPLRIEMQDQTYGIGGKVAQYYGMESLAAMEAKLAQFPRGTSFVLVVSGPRSVKAGAELRAFAAEKGLTISAQ